MPVCLGIESSCDETAVAIVDSSCRILAERIASQDDLHARWGGVVPELAARAHADRLAPMIETTLADAGLALPDIDIIAATAGPGLIGGVMVGLVTAKSLAFAAAKPLHAINHLEGHALSPRLAEPSLAFPYLLLLVSGGHCQLLAVEAVGRYRRLATTIDDAAGEAFDKVAKLLGLGFPGGPALERAALAGDAAAVPLPRPMVGGDDPHFSFAGLKSAAARALQSHPRPEDVAAATQAAIADCLEDRTARALAAMPHATALVVAGGVAANTRIRARLAALATAHGLPFVAPPLKLCTDNAAMIAWAALERHAAGLPADDLATQARPRWPLDPTAESARGAGVKA